MKKITTSNIILINKNKDILFVKRAKGPDSGDLWSLPGGTSEKKENKEDTLVREIKEELGFVLLSFLYFKSLETNLPDKQITSHYFFGEIDNSIILDKIELSDYDWVNKNYIPTNLAFNQNAVLSDFIEFYFKKL